MLRFITGEVHGGGCGKTSTWPKVATGRPRRSMLP